MIDIGAIKEDLGNGMSPKCVVRLITSEFKTTSGYVLQKKLVPLKKKSNGYQCLQEDFSNGEEILRQITNIYAVEDGIYEVRMCQLERDWETGYLEDWKLELVPYEECS